MKKFFGEFKKFISRGNVLDMAVGVIIGGAFTGIVNGISNNILKPIINWVIMLVLGGDGLSGAITILSGSVQNADGTIDLTNAIYIDWGAFISAVINFFLIAIVLFVIVKTMNKIKEEREEFQEKIKKSRLTKEDKKALKERGIKPFDKKAVEAYLAEKKKLKEEKAKAEKLEAEEKARKERLENPTTEDLLKKLIEIVEKK